MTGARLHVDGVTVQIGTTTILRDITIDLTAGNRHAIIGPNGAGKSTLLAAIAGNRRTAAGRILLDDQDITRHPADRVARLGVGFISQQPAICRHLTALANVELGVRCRLRSGERSARACAALQDVDLAEHSSTAAGTLSYGQQRRLELAIALAGKPRLLLLDEPSAGLTANDVTQLIGHLHALAPETTILIVEHDQDVVDALADEVTTLDRGRVIERATRADICARNKRPAIGAIPRVDATPTPVRREGRRHTAKPVLQVRHLSAGYHDTTILDHINLDLAAGEILHIDGPNGAGKTTLLHAIAGLIRTGPDTTIFMHERSIADLTAAQRARRGLTLIPQDGRPFTTLTIAENLHVGSAVTDPLQRPLVDLIDTMRRRPRLTDRANGLSGGEQQLVVLAQALAARPTVLLLDEPFTRLAPALTDHVRQFINQLAEHGTGVILVDHASPNPAYALRTAVLARDDPDETATLHHGHPA